MYSELENKEREARTKREYEWLVANNAPLLKLSMHYGEYKKLFHPFTVYEFQYDKDTKRANFIINLFHTYPEQGFYDSSIQYCYLHDGERVWPESEKSYPTRSKLISRIGRYMIPDIEDEEDADTVAVLDGIEKFQAGLEAFYKESGIEIHEKTNFSRDNIEKYISITYPKDYKDLQRNLRA